MCSSAEAADSETKGSRDAASNGQSETLPLSPDSTSPSTSSASHNPLHNPHDPRRTLQRGTWYAAGSLWLLLVASSLTMPHQQGRRDALQCDQLCFGSLTSYKATLKLIGAALIGRVSDYPNTRKACLWMGLIASAVGIAAASQAQSISQLWLATIPLALEQNIHVLRAVVSEYHDAVPQSTSGERASSAGKLGMASGLAMMMGPVMGTLGVKTYSQATRLSLVLLGVACVLIARLPTVERKETARRRDANPRQRPAFWRVWDVPSARSPAALVILACRLLSTLSFYIYQTILTASLKDRFDFQPRDYGTFFSVIGLFFALSQGFAAKWLLDRFGEKPTRRVRLLLLCSFVVGASRYLAFYTLDIWWLYALFSIMVTSYGVISTIFAGDTSQIAAPEELGSFFGLLATVEQGAGMAGPLLGGALSYYVHPTRAPLLAVMSLNAATLGIIAWGYDRFVTNRVMQTETKAKND